MTDTKSLSDNAAQAYQTGDFERAATLYAQAAAGVQGLEAAELNNNASVSWLQAGNTQAAYDAVSGSAEIFAAAGDIRRQALALGNEAAALEALARAEEAIARYQACADLLETIGEDQLRQKVMQSIAGLLMRRGKFFDALFAMNSGLRDLKKPTLKQKILRALLKLRW